MATGAARYGLARLRAKTDRELIILINLDIERAQALAGLETSPGEYREAESLYAKAKILTAFVGAPEEREDLERKLEELRMALDDADPAAAMDQSAYC